jgi:NADP-dependent 3-hydroxy acid dehydrogenase YdfG
MDFIRMLQSVISINLQLESTANAERLPLKLIQLDVTEDRSGREALEKIVLEKGRIDVLVNNAGYWSSLVQLTVIS